MESKEFVENVERASKIIKTVGSRLSDVIVSQPDYVLGLQIGLLTGKPIGATGIPGTSKTHGAKALAHLIGGNSEKGEFKRIQFTTDLLPSDISGNDVYDKNTGEWVFKPGPVFANVVLCDEVNRAPGRTHSGMLEVMDEGQVTSNGIKYSVPEGQVMIFTYNPSESAGTEEMPDAFNDRMIITVKVGHIPEDKLVVMGQKYFKGELAYASEPVIDQSTIVELQSLVRQVASNSDEDVFAYAARIIGNTWDGETFSQDAGERAFLALMHVAGALALMDNGKVKVESAHVTAAAPYVLRHRLQLPYNATKSIEEAIKELL